MAIAGTSFSNFAGGVLRNIRNLHATVLQSDKSLNVAERAPLQREELTTLFQADFVRAPIKSDPLRDSERLEREKMSMIRGALYAAE
jgi:hypothetical protein